MTGNPRTPDGAYEAFLRADRPDDVLCYLADEAVSDPAALTGYGRRVDGGTVLVLPGERGRALLDRVAGIDPMALATHASETGGTVARDCTTGTCPDDGPDDHRVRLVFAFAEPQSDDAGGRYAEGDVVHAYAVCACGTAYADRWTVEPS